MADECVLDKQIDFLDVIQVEDGQAVRWSQDGVPQKQVLEVFVHLVFCKMLLYKHLHQVVHDLDEASHLFFIEMLLDSEVSCLAQAHKHASNIDMGIRQASAALGSNRASQNHQRLDL